MEDEPTALGRMLSNKDKNTLAVWAAGCAEHVLPYFETKYPKDKRPRAAVLAVRKWLRGELSVGEVRVAAFAAHAAARKAQHDQAIYAARSAGQAAGTVHVEKHAIHAAEYAVKAVLSSASQNPEEEAAKERSWQIHLLLDLEDKRG